MKWKQIDRSKRIQYDGIYNDWKQQISNDCHNQCVYCSIHENPWGGIDHYHIDHYRPKSKFEHLTNVITNLYYACPICNRFKSDDWPNEPDSLDNVCYPDPSDNDFTNLYTVDLNNFKLAGLYIASRYLINKLYLNRPQLIYERREDFLKLKAEALIEDLRNSLRILNEPSSYQAAFELIANITQHLHTRSNIKPYTLIEIRK
jgi:hypothetical protein